MFHTFDKGGLFESRSVLSNILYELSTLRDVSLYVVAKAHIHLQFIAPEILPCISRRCSRDDLGF